MSTTARPQWFGFLAGLFLSASLVLAALIVSRAWLKVAEPQTVTVTGSSRRTVHSDLILWKASFSTEAATLLEAQNTLKQHRSTVEAFLATQGVTNAIISSIAITPLKERTAAGESDSRTAGYRLAQTVEIRSPEVARILGLDQTCMVLVEQGVAFVPMTPQFIYTGAADAKIEMLAEATRDARQRADQIAREGGRRVKNLRSARMGVFQITPLYSGETSWDGMNDTTAADKSINSVVNAQFTIE